jgi:predicted DNA-binding transcriptional regulator AlpA
MKHEITLVALIDEVALLNGVSESTIRKWLADRRRGIGTFPLPISKNGAKLRWLRSDILTYLSSQSQATQPVASSTQQVRRDQKEFHQRQAEAEKALARHRKPK